MGIGVITAVETEDGTVNTSDIDADMRRKWARRLVRKLNSLDGVEQASLSSLSKCTGNQTGSIEIELPYSTPYRVERTNRVVLDANPRSVSPRIRNVFKNTPQVSTHTVEVTPDCHNETENEYYTNYYIVTFAFV